MLTRRTFLATAGAAPLLVNSALGEPEPPARKKIAIISTVWTYHSHSQHMGDRFLVGYPRHGQWHNPPLDVVSLYVDQRPEGDLSAKRAAEHGFTVYPSIAETLRCGGDKLSVDGVVIIGEHGNYPRNQKGQNLYPRYEFFQQAIEVFEKDGRAVPIYNDKHLSYSAEKAARMVADSKRLKFAFLAGSSLPVTWRLPPVEVPYDAVIEDALMVGIGGSDAMDYHALEALQCMVERRKGGETGIKSVQMLEGDAVWKAGEEGVWSRRLLEAALSRSDSLQGYSQLDSRPQDLANNGELPGLVKTPSAYLIERNDGLRTTLLMLNGALEDYTFAARLQGGQILSTQFFLSPKPNVTYSACLVAQIEDMIMTGQAPYPVERTQITSAMLDRLLDSKVEGHRRLETPELKIAYRAPRESRFGD
ncbi:hypothetical protein [Singulisphaera acidiphila]|uniref:Uncharacterized protein n=1 Tax=Singulisphaera acidiphila (strain ATCC BAA-1392 / DSM 18658 / VKM B-2454 / MOB10) TaxID=886293 RepID=L0DCR3_SINAD|nr:hypothetical protein [Singulisphaera acidiphila]AGA26426.1 hypothetical protein Sinac_2091 [Singulisphaera acidiphila DSM 18658]